MGNSLLRKPVAWCLARGGHSTDAGPEWLGLAFYGLWVFYFILLW